MNKPHTALRVGVSVLIFFVVAYGVVDFLAVDDCLDHGGRINETTGACEKNGEYIPLLKKAGLIFWSFIIIVGLVPASVFYWLFGNFKSNGK